MPCEMPLPRVPSPRHHRQRPPNLDQIATRTHWTKPHDNDGIYELYPNLALSDQPAHSSTNDALFLHREGWLLRSLKYNHALLGTIEFRETMLVVDLNPVADVPKHVLLPILIEHQGLAPVAEIVSREIKTRIGHPRGTRVGGSYFKEDDDACSWYSQRLVDHIKILATFGGLERWIVEILLLAYEYRATTHHPRCLDCQREDIDTLESEVLRLILKLMAEHGDGNQRHRLFEVAEQVRQTRRTWRDHHVDVFPRIMANVVVWIAPSTAWLLADRVAGHKLPRELVESIAEFYKAEVAYDLFHWSRHVNNGAEMGTTGRPKQDWTESADWGNGVLRYCDPLELDVESAEWSDGEL